MTIVIDLARTLPDPPTSVMMRARLPHLAGRMQPEALAAMDVDPRYRVLGTRSLADRVIAANPSVPCDVVLDASGVEVASTPFLTQLLNAWPDARMVNANEDVRNSWGMAVERRR